MRVLRYLTSHRLPCGCIVGVYELYSGQVAAIVDAHATNCADEAHRQGLRVEEPGPLAVPAARDDRWINL